MQLGNSLVTGGNGFLGSIIASQLSLTGYAVDSLGRSEENEIIVDLAASAPKLVKAYDMAVLCSGKAHSVPQSLSEEREFYNINVKGIYNLTKAFEELGKFPKRIVLISSVSVYGLEEGELIDETFPLLGKDAYSKSKVDGEKFLSDWCDAQNVPLTILRLPLVCGPNPPGNLGKMIDAIKKGKYFRIGGGGTRRSMVLAQDVANLISKSSLKSGIYNLTDGYHPTFREIETLITSQLKLKEVKSLPLGVIYLVAKLGDVINFFLRGRFPLTSKRLGKMINTLTFSDVKARAELGWNPNYVINEFRIF